MFLRMCVLGLSLSGLVGCAQVTDRVAGGIANISAPADATSEGIRTLALLDGDVRVRGPEGYCVDQGASNAREGFAVLVGCALLSEEAAVMPRLDGLITVQFGDEGTGSVTGNESTFSSFLTSDEGRGLLSANGDIASLSELSTVTDASGVLVRFTDASAPVFPGTSGQKWRGFLDVDSRLTTVSVLSFERNQLSRSEAERLLIVAMNEIIDVNAQPQLVAESN